MADVTKEARPMDERDPVLKGMGKIRVTITWENGDPICRYAPEVTLDFLTD